MRRMSVGLLNHPIKTINAEPKVLTVAFAPEVEMVEMLQAAA